MRAYKFSWYRINIIDDFGGSMGEDELWNSGSYSWPDGSSRGEELHAFKSEIDRVLRPYEERGDLFDVAYGLNPFDNGQLYAIVKCTSNNGTTFLVAEDEFRISDIGKPVRPGF